MANEPLDIVLDLGALGEDFTLKGIALEIFFSGLKARGHQLHVPETSLDELASRYRSKIQNLNHWQDWIFQEYRRLGGSRKVPGKGLLPEEDEFREYHSRQKELLSAQGAKFLPFPQLDSRMLNAKAIHQKLPFKDPVTGYRDCLVWFSLIFNLSGTQRPLAFITASRAGFGHDKPNHIDLQSDLLEFKIDPDQVTILNSVDEANHRFLIPEMGQFEDVDFVMGENPHQFQLTHWFREHILEVAEAQGWMRQVAGLAETNAQVGVEGIKKVRELHVDDIRILDERRLLLFAHATSLLDVHITYTAKDYYNDNVLPEVLRPNDPIEGTVFLEMESVIAFSMVLDNSNLKVLQAEIDAVEGNGFNYFHLMHPWHFMDGEKGEG